MPERLRVLMDGRLAGWLSQAGDRVTLRYDEEYALDPTATPLSVTMPLTQLEHSGRSMKNWLANLLPDNDVVRERWSQQFQVANTPYALLAHVGADCAGAVQFLPEDEWEALGAGGLLPLSESQVAARLRALERDPASVVYENTRGQFSLAGAQAKMALRREDGNWSEPWGSEPTSHILKPPMPGLAHQELNEHLCLQLAQRLGLPAANSRASRFGKQRAIVVTRYDRLTVGGRLIRLHQEDLCQAMGLSPASKYERDKGPSAVDILGVLRRHLPPVVADQTVLTFVRALALQWALFATDGHAKNYSLLLNGPQVRLAPLYDLNTALPYLVAQRRDLPPGLMSRTTTRLAMSVGGRSGVDDVDSAAWRRFAEQARLDPDTVVDLVTELTSHLDDVIDEVLTEACGSGDLSQAETVFVRSLGQALHRRAGLCRVALLGRTPPSRSRRAT